MTRDFAHAAEYYAQLAAMTHGDERENALLAVARVDEQMAKTDDAMKAIETVLREDGSNWAAHVRHGILLSRQRKYEKADLEFQQATAAYEKFGNREGLCDVLLARAAAFGRNDLARSHKDMERVLELSSQTGNRYHN